MPDLPLPVRPGALWEDGSEATPSMLNLTANPTVSIEENSITSDLIDKNEFIETFQPSMRAVNYLPWGSFHWDAFRKGGLSMICPAGRKTEPVAGWWVEPQDAEVSAIRAEGWPDNQLSGHCLKVTSAVPNDEVQIGTYLPPQVTTLAQGTLFFTAQIFNATDVAFTPDLFVTPSAVGHIGDEGVLAGGIHIPGTDLCGNGIWTKVRFPINPATVDPASWLRGAHVSLFFGDGVMAPGKSVSVAQASLDKDAESPQWISNLAELSPYPPGFMLPWPGDSSAIPTGWLYCNGLAVSTTTYPKLYDVIGDKYKIGAGPGAGLFNLPDGRGTVLFGAEVDGQNQDRAQVQLTGCSVTAPNLDILTVSATGNLRYGMGVLNANFAAGVTIIDIISATQVRTSAPATSAPLGSPVVRFSKLGWEGDPQIVGNAGGGMPTTGNRIVITRNGCSTSTVLASAAPSVVVPAGYILTVPSTGGLAAGMLIDCPNVPVGAKIVSLLSTTTLRMDKQATLTAGSLTATFRIDAGPSAQESTYQHLLRNNVIAVVAGTGTDGNPTTVGEMLNRDLKVGSYITASAGLSPNTFIKGINADGQHILMSSPTGQGNGVALEYTFRFDDHINVAGAPVGPRWMAVNWMIKT